jgi:glc operon protein GlcG
MVGKGQSKKGPAVSLPIETRVLSYGGAQTMLVAAIAKAIDMNVPQCISIVNAGGHLLAFIGGRVVGAIGVGSCAGEQDRQVVTAALRAVPGAKRFN